MAIRIRLTWEDNNSFELGHRVYRSISPMDPEDLPEPLADLGPGVTVYLDEDVEVDSTYYYRVSAYTSVSEEVSDEVAATATAPSWTPTDSDPHLWLDASDSSTITIVSGLVSLWSDKSGKGNHMDQPNSSWRPVVQASAIGSMSAVYINTGKSLGRNSTNILRSVNGGSITVLKRHRNPNLISQYVAHAKLFASNSGPAPGKLQGGARRNNADSNTSVNSDTNTTNNFEIFTVSVDYLTGTLLIGVNGVYKNGPSLPTTGVSEDSTSVFALGGNTGAYSAPTSFNNANFGGDIAELIILPNSSDYQKAEGYIAHKWGLASLLPVGHPYKNSAP